MPLLEGGREANPSAGAANSPVRRQSQLSSMAKSAIMSSASPAPSPAPEDLPPIDQHDSQKPSSHMGPPKSVAARSIGSQLLKENKLAPSQAYLSPTNGIGHALNDTPLSTAPSSPQMQVTIPKLKTNQ